MLKLSAVGSLGIRLSILVAEKIPASPLLESPVIISDGRTVCDKVTKSNQPLVQDQP